jgi:hypothetical protein
MTIVINVILIEMYKLVIYMCISQYKKWGIVSLITLAKHVNGYEVKGTLPYQRCTHVQEVNGYEIITNVSRRCVSITPSPNLYSLIMPRHHL